MVKFGERVKQLRLSAGMTQEQLAEAMNVSAAAVSKWENGQSVPDILVLTALADFFEVSLDALVGYTVQAHRRGDMVARIRQLVVQKKHTEATRAAREALRRSPVQLHARKHCPRRPYFVQTQTP